MRIEVSANRRSMPPQEQKVEALGTVIANDGLTVLSLSTVDQEARYFLAFVAILHPSKSITRKFLF